MKESLLYEEVLPIILRIIQQEHEQKKRFIQEGEIIRALRRDPEYNTLRTQISSKRSSSHHAQKVLSQFHQEFAKGVFMELEREKVNSRWAYRPTIYHPWMDELLKYNGTETDISLLIHPNIPAPLHNVNIRSIKGEEWWQKLCREARRRHRAYCHACGTGVFPSALEVHEHYDIDYVHGEARLAKIVLLCADCHNFIHSDRVWDKYHVHDLSFEDVDRIYTHGFALLRLAQLPPYWKTEWYYHQLHGKSKQQASQLLKMWGVVNTLENMASWEQWHVVLDGQKYYTPYKDRNEWRQAMVPERHPPEKTKTKPTRIYVLKSSEPPEKEASSAHSPDIKQDLSLLTHPNIPKPLHGINPRTIKGQEWWDEVRQWAYRENQYHCWACGIHKFQAKYRQWLEAHEYYDIDYTRGEVTLNKIVALCHPCHQFIHSERLWLRYYHCYIRYEQIHDIYNHGFALLRLAKLQPYWRTVMFDLRLHGKSKEEALDLVTKWGLVNEPEDVAPWQQWHLILDGETYYTPYKNIEEWKQHWGGE